MVVTLFVCIEKFCLYSKKKNCKNNIKTNLICNFVELKNYRIHIGILTLFCLVFFMIPSQSFACSKNSTKTERSCAKEKSKKSEHKKGCKDKSCKNAKAATAMVVVHIALADAVLQRPPYTYQSQSN